MKPISVLRQVRGPAVVLAGYLILRAVFDALTERGGLISPTGSVDLGVAMLGVGVVGLRIVGLFVVAPVVVYRVVAGVLDRR